MRKITLRGARGIACIALAFLIALTTVFALSDVKTVALLGGESYSPYYFGDRGKPEVSIMINVYENADVVNEMLDVLKEYGCRATFFVGGCWADDNTETVRRIADSGNEIGNHGYFHKDPKSIDAAALEREISTNHALIKSLCGVDMSLFAPPSGSFDQGTLKIVEKSGYKTVMWTKDTIDWRDDDVNTLVKRATEDLENGDFILMHPKPHSVAALKEILKIIKEKKLEAVTVSESLGINGKGNDA